MKDEKKAAKIHKKKMCGANKAALERIKSITLENAVADKNIESYIALIKEFKDISALDKVIVHMLIDKITVGNKYVENRVKKQDILRLVINLLGMQCDFSNGNQHSLVQIQPPQPIKPRR
ncbi:MAG: DUF4368 domain-containing protein [Oscillospiraceae bacterium]